MSQTSGKHSAFSRWFGFHTLDPERFVTSYFISPFALLCVRGLITLYLTWALIFTFYVNFTANTISLMYSYFTNLTFAGLWGYYVSSLVHSILYNIRHDASSFKDHFYIASSHWILYHTIIISNILTPIVFWSLLSGTLIQDHSSAQTWYNNINVHGLTLIWMLTDVILTRQRVSTRMFIFTILITILFVFESWVTHAVDGIWVYPFLSWSKGPMAAVWYIGVGIFVIIVIAVQRYIIHPLRDLVGKKYGRYCDQYSETDESSEENESQRGWDRNAISSFSTEEKSTHNVV